MNDFDIDPCPACKPNTVCRTPSCGRLKGKRQEPVIKDKQAEPVAFDVMCESCGGSGLDRKDSNYGCGTCNSNGFIEKLLYTAPPAVAQIETDDCKSWYIEAMIASNEAGYVGLSAAQTIRELNKRVHEAPAAAINEQLLEALIIAGGSIMEICKERDVPIPHSTMRRIDAAINQAKSVKKGV